MSFLHAAAACFRYDALRRRYFDVTLPSSRFSHCHAITPLLTLLYAAATTYRHYAPCYAMLAEAAGCFRAPCCYAIILFSLLSLILRHAAAMLICYFIFRFR